MCEMVCVEWATCIDGSCVCQPGTAMQQNQCVRKCLASNSYTCGVNVHLKYAKYKSRGTKKNTFLLVSSYFVCCVASYARSYKAL